MKRLDRIFEASLFTNMIADVGKYASLLYGMANVIEDKPDMNKIIGAGAVYFICGVMQYASRGLLARAWGERLEEKLNSLSGRIK